MARAISGEDSSNVAVKSGAVSTDASPRDSNKTFDTTI